MPLPIPQKDQTRLEFVGSCMANKAMKKEFPDNKQRAAVCYGQWSEKWKGSGNMELMILTQTISNYQTQIRQHQGRDHLVVPVVMLTEGVHDGSGGRLLYTAKEMSKYPARWNGVAIPVYHPTEDGSPISANDPSVLDEFNTGRLFNVTWDHQSKKLRGEAWIDIALAQSKFKDTYEALLNKEPMEISTGLAHELEYEQGTWNDETYEAVVKNIMPDHLALLPGAKGACSWEDGCGIRFNQKTLKLEEVIKDDEFLKALNKLGLNVEHKEVSEMANDKKCCPEKVEAVVNHEHTIYTNADVEFLEAMEEDMIDKIIAKADEFKKATGDLAANQKELKKVQAELVTINKKVGEMKQTKNKAEIKKEDLPEEMRTILNHGKILLDEDMQKNITALLAYDRCPYKEEQLKTMNFQQLRDLARMLPEDKAPDFSGNAPKTKVTDNKDDFCMPKEEVPK